MGLSEIVFGFALVVGLVGLSAYIGWRQVRTLRGLRGLGLPNEEQQWERRKAQRRLASSALTLVMAGLLAALLVYYEPPAGRLADERQAQGEARVLTEEERALVRVWGGLVIALLLVLLAVLALAAIDLWATRTYALKQYRKIQADRRAMIERQATRMRQERNGHK